MAAKRGTLIGWIVALGAALITQTTHAAEIGIGSASGVPGENVDLEVTLDDAGDSVYRVAVVLELPPGFASPRRAGNPDCRFLVPEASFGFIVFGSGPCASAEGCTRIVMQVATGDRLGNGGLASCRITTAFDAAAGLYPVEATEVYAFGFDGEELPASASAGTIEVRPGAALNSGVVTAAAGQETAVEVRFGANVTIASVAHDLVLPPEAVLRVDELGGPACSAGGGLSSSCISFAFLPAGCAPEQGCRGVHAAIDGACTGCAVPPGSTLFSCDVRVRAVVVAGDYPITIANATAVDSSGAPVAVAASDGVLFVNQGAYVSVDAGWLGLHPGESGTMIVNLGSNLVVDGLRHELAFEPAARIAADESGQPRCATLAGGREALISFLPEDCAAPTECEAIRVIFPSLGMPAFARSAPLYRCTVQVALDAPAGVYPLRIESIVASGPDGPQLPGANGRDGTVTVQDAFAATVTGGSAAGRAGERVTLEVTLDNEGDVAGTQNDIPLTPSLRVAARPNGRPSCRLGPEIRLGGNSFAFQPSGCDPSSTCTLMRALVLSLDNIDPIPDGAVLYSCEIEIAPGTPSGAYAIEILNVGASDRNGSPVAIAGQNGTIRVEPPPATATATPAATSTITAQPPSPTAPATSTPRDDGDGSCTVLPVSDGGAWWLLLPIAVLCRRRAPGGPPGRHPARRPGLRRE